jgi:hypothetical protein
MSFNREYEYAHSAALPDWLKDFANNELKRGTSPFEAIKDIFKENDLDAVENHVKELRDKVGLDKIASEEKIHGGLGDGNPDSRYDKDQLEKGIKVELEHTNDPKKAKEVVKDHLEETKDFKGGKGAKYYDKLEDMEDDVKKELVKKKSELINNLILLANELDSNGKKDAAAILDKCILSLSNEMNQMVPDVFNKHEGIKKHIDNVCKSRQGHINGPALMQMIMSRPEREQLSDTEIGQIREYIKKTIKENKKEVDSKSDDNIIGLNEIDAFEVQEDDGNMKVFDEPSKV